MRIIGIHGKARSGKDEFSIILCKTYGFKRMAFADIIRELGIKYYKLKPEEIFETKTPESRKILQGIGVSVRENISRLNNLFNIQPVATQLGVSGFPRWAEDIAIEEFGIEACDLRRKLKYLKTVLTGNVEMWANELDMFIRVSRGIDQDIWVNHLLDQCTKDIVYVIPDVRFLNEYKKLSEHPSAKVIKIFRIDNPIIEAGSTHISERQLNNVIDWNYKIVNEHKNDWRERLVLSASNMVRKFDYENFFQSSDMDKFKINILA